MKRAKSLNQIVAENLRYFMNQPGCAYSNPNALGVKAGIAANSVRNLLTPTRRTTVITKPEGFPTLDKLEKIALALNREVWELLHPDIRRSLREREMYRTIAADFAERAKADPGLAKAIVLEDSKPAAVKS